MSVLFVCFFTVVVLTGGLFQVYYWRYENLNWGVKDYGGLDRVAFITLPDPDLPHFRPVTITLRLQFSSPLLTEGLQQASYLHVFRAREPYTKAKPRWCNQGDNMQRTSEGLGNNTISLNHERDMHQQLNWDDGSYLWIIFLTLCGEDLREPTWQTAKWIECRKFQICFKLCLMSSKRKNFFPTWFNHKLTKSSRNSWPPAQQSNAFPGGLFIFEGPSRSNCPTRVR